MLSVMLLGFGLGMRHALDSDHVAAVGAIASRERSLRAAAFVALGWGVGHSIAIFLVGGAMIAFGLFLPEELVVVAELAVAAMLVIIGFTNLLPSHAAHDVGDERSWSVLRSSIVGMVHGLAGSAGVALLALATIRDSTSALMYLGVFGLGTIGGMFLLTFMLAVPFTAVSRRFDGFAPRITHAAGMFSIAVGVFLACRITFVESIPMALAWMIH